MPPGSHHTGAAVLRLEDRRLVLGAGQFLADIVLPRMLALGFVRSPHAHAAVRGIDLAPPAMSDVRLFTAPDLAAVARPLRPRIDFPPNGADRLIDPCAG